MVFLFIYGLLLQYREGIPERTSVAFEVLMIVGGTIFSLLSAYVSWSYDALILRLAPPDYDLILFQ
ncbi:hypothetical protein ABID39_001347 [Bartonella japonica]|uniref:Uncharacterized protein n=1 Tax=Bartonella japonica TaxID=357761 RepID=A0ABV2FPZ1_9HYPH